MWVPAREFFLSVMALLSSVCLPVLAQTITEFPIPSCPHQPYGIAAGADGALWFTEFYAGRIGRITTAGVVSEYGQLAGPLGITLGPDGALWFAETSGNKVGRITTAGVINEFDVPGNSQPAYIVPGPDGNLWFTEYQGNKIGRITPTGDIAEFAIPTIVSVPRGITSGPDGALWFTEAVGNKIGRIRRQAQSSANKSATLRNPSTTTIRLNCAGAERLAAQRRASSGLHPQILRLVGFRAMSLDHDAPALPPLHERQLLQPDELHDLT